MTRPPPDLGEHCGGENWELRDGRWVTIEKIPCLEAALWSFEAWKKNYIEPVRHYRVVGFPDPNSAEARRQRVDPWATPSHDQCAFRDGPYCVYDTNRNPDMSGHG